MNPLQPRHTDRTVLHCDIVIIGAGPAGLAAAKAAALSTQQILLIDDNIAPGGQIWRDGPAVTLPAQAQEYRALLAEHPAITLLSGSRIVVPLAPGHLLYEDQLSCGEIHYQTLILCCGARELLLPFPGWTLPGVTGAGGLQAQIKSGLEIPGERVVISGSGPLLLAVAHSVHQAGAHITTIAEQASLRTLWPFALHLWRWPVKVRQALMLMDRHYRADSYVLEALGEQRLEAVRLRQGRHERVIPCDRLACGYGLVPNSELGQLLGCQTQQQAIAVDTWQQTSINTVYAAGECTGIGGSELSLIEGAIAGYSASGQTAQAAALFPQRARWQAFAHQVSRAFPLRPQLTHLAQPDTLICRCEDVPLGKLAGYTHWQEAKLSHRCGMGACQGRICATAAHHLLGWAPPAPRAPLTPVRTATLSGVPEQEAP